MLSSDDAPEMAEIVRIERDRTTNKIIVRVLNDAQKPLADFLLEPEHAYQIARDLQKCAAYGLERIQAAQAREAARVRLRNDDDDRAEDEKDGS